MAELQEEKVVGNLASLEECRRLVESSMVQTREAVRKLKCLDDAQKRAVGGVGECDGVSIHEVLD